MKYLYYPGVDMYSNDNNNNYYDDSKHSLRDSPKAKSSKSLDIDSPPGIVTKKIRKVIINRIVNKPLAQAEKFLAKIGYYARIVEADDTPFMLRNDHQSRRVNVFVSGEEEIIYDGSEDVDRTPYFG